MIEKHIESPGSSPAALIPDFNVVARIKSINPANHSS